MGTDAGFGGLLRRERVLRGLTQEQLAEAAGLTSRSIRSLEAGRTQPRRSTVTLLCDALDLDRGKRQALLRACGFADRSVKTEPERDGPATLPRDIPDFVGRSGLLETLRGRLLSGTETATRIVAINGLGGIGKTTLAVHLAHQVRAAFADGQLFADLEGGSGRGRDPDAVLGSMLADLGVAPERLPAGRGSRSALLRSLTADRSLLFLLDNAADTAQVRALLPSSASCAVLVTSRRYLAALEGAHHATVGPFTSDQSRTLLTAVCAPALLPGDEDGVARIIDCCAGLPLALRIAGAQLAAPSSPGATALAAQLSEAARRLDGFTAEDLSVRSTLAASVESLDVADPVGRLARSALFFLGRWPGGAVGAQCTAAALGTTSQRARQALDHLADMSLLQTGSGSTARTAAATCSWRGVARRDWLPRTAGPAAPSSLPYPLLMQALLEAGGRMHGGGCRGQASDNKGYGSFHGRALLLQRVQIEQIQVKKIRAAQNRKQGRKLAGSSTRRRTR
jgi:transcriptional regulator with XRE-family HTH domain